MRIGMIGHGSEEELRSLREWLLESPEIRRHTRIAWDFEEPQPGEMSGGTVAAIQLITDNLWQIATFALSYATWRKTRSRNTSVTIEHNGRRLGIESNEEDTVNRIIRELGDE
ncbi:hypothetical protein ACFWBF_18880 [Streptomyces sp. NPDC060028]|uniref:effector-associated constant component EACC1 n=1 Tax=Streptomyces sp. NPDC060028 TaxID=3347041 RepID=UPI0036C7BC93